MRPDLTVENVIFMVLILVMPVLVFATAVLIDHIVCERREHNDTRETKK